ncbi:MAG: component of IIS longevity pathway SMK-1-domain-containing protein [Olpidium bornovanus]|uniref:Component of IIS longevity pathway SMK-1-domain-containing protein n=1 Tax=Olpidium bornovanus TaxID=278681 RepID=A0A8H8DG10_9FUNG|nr:MAG: component of IIS longevity pathway SMK-1-domain-containing protein [Olpidium bornovanus]
MKQDTIFQVAGVHENLTRSPGRETDDPDYPSVNFDYRRYLSDPTIFKEVVPIRDPKLKAKIHETFWLQYLKDVVLARVLDDQAFSILNSRIFFNNVEIISLLQRDRQFFEDLFDLLKEGTDEPIKRRRDAVLFIQQFCTLAKNLQQVNLVALYRYGSSEDIVTPSFCLGPLLAVTDALPGHDARSSLSTHGLFRVFHFAFQDPAANIRMAGADVLSSILEHDPGLVRSYILVQIRTNAQPPLLESIIDRLLTDQDFGVRIQFVEVMRILLGTNRVPGGIEALMEGRPPPRVDEEAAQFLEAFYDPYMKQVCAPLLELSSEDRMVQIGTFLWIPGGTACENIWASGSQPKQLSWLPTPLSFTRVRKKHKNKNKR